MNAPQNSTSQDMVTYLPERQEILQKLNDFIIKLKKVEPKTGKTQIIIIGTGWTFQSAELDDGKLAPSWSLSESLKALQLPADERVEIFDGESDERLFELFNLDSANMTVLHWSMLWEIITKMLFEISEYIDGIIVTHGTDTMARGASYLSFMIQNSPKPIIFTGSQKPARQKWTDAWQNMKNSIWAIQKAKETWISEVMVLCWNTLVRWTWATKVWDETYNPFISFNQPQWEESIISSASKWDEISRIFPQLIDFKVPEWIRNFFPHARKYDPNKIQPLFIPMWHDADIMRIPTTDISDEQVQAVLKTTSIAVFDLLWSATANDRIVNVIESFRQQNKIILFRSPFHDSTLRAWHYSAGSAVSKMNVCILNTSQDALIAKANYISHRLNLFSKWEMTSEFWKVFDPLTISDFQEIMGRNLVWELI